MMRSFPAIAAALIALTLPAAAAAGEIALRAGEHEGYSRVVVADAAAVSVTRADGSIGLHFPAGAAGFDLSDINQRRKARRVSRATATLTAAGALVRLDLSCDCRVEQQRLPDGRLVIDIHGAPPPRAAAVQTAAPRETPNPPPARSQSPESSVSVEEARARMIELLQRAADDGLVTIREDSPELSRPTQLTPVAAPTPALSSAAAAAPARDAPRQARACLPDAAFALDGSGLDADPLGTIAALQARLAQAPAGGEHAAIEALAEGYLAIAFGDEALSTLAEYGEGASLRAEMARVVAERPLDNAGLILGADDCRGAHALWQAAAAEGARSAAAAARAGDAALATPPRLRAVIAARIARRMIDAGDMVEARRYRDFAAAASPRGGPDLEYVAARLSEADGGDAEKELRTLAAGNTDASKDALLALAERYAQSGDAPQGFVEDIGALAKIEAGSARGGAAALREAAIWAEEGNIEASVMLLRNAARNDPALAPAAAARARDILALAFERPQDAKTVAALDAYLHNRGFIDQGGVSVAPAAAAAAMSMGLPNVAARLLPASQGDAPAALLRARALIAAGDAERALETAAPYADDPAFAALVVEANFALGRDFAALAAAAALGEGGDKAGAMADAAWRAGDYASAARAWRKVEPTQMSAETARRYALAAYMAGAATMPPAADAVLREAGAADLAGLNALFAAAHEASLLDRGKAAVSAAAQELNMMREILGDG